MFQYPSLMQSAAIQAKKSNLHAGSEDNKIGMGWFELRIVELTNGMVLSEKVTSRQENPTTVNATTAVCMPPV